MSTLGGRLGLAALKILGDGEGAWAAVYLTRTCALDGIAETTGLSDDGGTLKVQQAGRHALRLQRGRRMVELELSPAAMQQAGGYRKLSCELEAGWDDLDQAEKDRREASKEAYLDDLLPRLWQATDDELITIREENLV